MSDEAEDQAGERAQANPARMAAAMVRGGGKVGRSKLDAIAPTVGQWGAIVEGADLNGALLIESLCPGEYSVERVQAFAAALRSRVAAVKAGDVSGLEADLVAQLAFLNALIAFAVRKGSAENIPPSASDLWLRLSIRAQGAYTRTAAVLATIALRPVNES